MSNMLKVAITLLCLECVNGFGFRCLNPVSLSGINLPRNSQIMRLRDFDEKVCFFKPYSQHSVIIVRESHSLYSVNEFQFLLLFLIHVASFRDSCGSIKNQGNMEIKTIQ